MWNEAWNSLHQRNTGWAEEAPAKKKQLLWGDMRLLEKPRGSHEKDMKNIEKLSIWFAPYFFGKPVSFFCVFCSGTDLHMQFEAFDGH